MNRKILGTALLVALTGMVAPVLAQHGDYGKKSAAKLPNCPIMGEPIDLTVSTATDQGPVFFCCKGCISRYEANSQKYAAKVAAQRKFLAALPKVQVTCPVTGEPVNADVTIEQGGKKVAFCCKGCVKSYQADPAKYQAKLANSYTYQTKCPVMDEEIDPKVFMTSAKGQKVYLCCKGCDKRLAANPAKYMPKLAAQGYSFKAKDFVAKKDHGHGHDLKGHGHGHGHEGHDH